MKYSTIHRHIKEQLHDCSAEVCRAGYAALMDANDPESLMRVIRKYWADLNHALWPVFSALMQQHYPDLRNVFLDYGIRYNESADRGLCVVDDGADTGDVILSGTVQAEVHGAAIVVVNGHADAELHDTAHAEVADCARVTGWDQTTIIACDRATVRAFGSSHVVADGAVTIHLSDQATIEHRRAYRVYRNQ